MKQRLEELAVQLTLAAKAYYSEGQSSMSDDVYDALLEELRQLDATHPLLSKVGASVVGEDRKKIEHVIPMLSSAKVKTTSELAKWIDWLQLEDPVLIAQPKIDGLSATLCFEEGKLQYIASRGDGNIGQDISHLACYLQGIVLRIPRQERIEIRGELYLPKDTPYDIEGRALRNNCVGLVNRKELSDDLKYVHFVAYSLLDNDTIATQEVRLELLKAWGFAVVEYYLCADAAATSDISNQYLEHLRAHWNYETDGLIYLLNDTSLYASIDARKVVERYHHYSMALKPPAQGKVTRLESIEWQISRQGNFVPVAIFASIQITGVNITRATLNNVDNVERLKLHLGHQLLIERANDVIPFVRENLDREGVLACDASLIPVSCSSCASVLVREGVHLKCMNVACPEVAIQTISYWVKNLQMQDVGSKTIRKLYEQGKVQSPSDLYRLGFEDLVCLEGFGQKRIENFLAQVLSTKQMESLTFLSILGIPLVGRKALIKLGIYTINDFLAYSNESYVIGKNIIQWLAEPHNRLLLEDLLSVLELSDTAALAKQTLSEERVVFTGKGALPRKEYQNLAVAAGYSVESTLSSKTTLVVCEDTQGKSSKLIKAKERGVLVISYTEFIARLSP
jgi:DNA ligase (NAD+)